MSRKTTAALVAVLAVNFTVAGAALMLANLNKPAEYQADAALDAKYSDIQEVASVKVDAEAGDLAVPLKAAQQGGNTRVTFTCGKKIPGGREVHEGTWDQIAGAVLYRPDDQELLAVEAVFDTRSLRTDTQALTTTVTTKEKWFDIEDHPTAVFRCSEISPNNAATPSQTHDLVGEFTLNGITKPLTIPAELSFSGQSLTIDASFTILRSDYAVEERDASLAGTIGGITSEVEDEVVLSVRVTASPDPAAVISELAQVVEQQQEQLRQAAAEINVLKTVVRRVEVLEENADRLASAPPAGQAEVDTAALPEAYTDFAEGDDGPVGFVMVLVPGDAEQEIAPFYMATHEVSWAMFRRWMYCNDLDQAGVSPHDIAQLIEQGVRPSPLYQEPAQLIDVPTDQRPAIAVSRLTAVQYCKWLSEKTGRRYRLPSIEEWRHAMKLGGGLPENLDDSAWHSGNRDYDDFGKPMTGLIGSKKPNAIGLYDMFGNACEWVTGTGVDRVVVGGHFFSPADRITEDWQAVEDVEVWNATHPQIPKGRFWVSDFHYTGIRLVCEPASVAVNPPKGG